MTVYPRLLYPDAASIDRVQATAGLPLLSSSGATARVYVNAAGTTLADILNSDESPNATATLTLDNESRLPEFYGPTSGVEKLWVRIDGGAPLAVFAQITERLAALETRVDAALATQDAENDAAFVRKGSLIVNVKDFGAVGDGSTNDTAAFDNARAASDALWIPAGTYIYDGAGLDANGLSITGAGPGQTTVLLGSGKALIKASGSISRMSVDNIRAQGGYGLIRLVGAGVSVQNLLKVAWCELYDYTGAAISNLAADQPYWRISHVIFQGANDTTTIGVALSGDSSGSVIEACSFNKNRVGVKLGSNAATAGGIDVKIVDCDFLRFSAYAGSPRTDIWVVPGSSQQSGSGFLVSGSKFGNENLGSGDDRVLYADENLASGSDISNRMPEYAADSTGWIDGHAIVNCQLGGSGGSAPSFIYSTTPNVVGLRVADISIIGTLPPYILKYRTPPGVDRTTQTNVFGPFQFSDVEQIAGTCQISNGKGVGAVIDPTAQLIAANPKQAQALPGGGNPAGYVRVLDRTVSTFIASGGAVATPTADALGGVDGAEVALAAGGLFYGNISPATGLVVGDPLWLEFDLAPSTDSAALTALIFEVQESSNGPYHFRRRLVVPDKWTPYRFLTHIRAVDVGLVFKFSSPTTGLVKIGRAEAYHGREPISRDLVAANVLGDVKVHGQLLLPGGSPALAPGAPAGAGATALLTGKDGAGRIQLNTGTAPTSGQLLTLTYSRPYAVAPYVAITPRNGGTGVNGPGFFASSTTTTLQIWCATAPAPGTTYLWDYHVIGTS